MSSRPVHLLVVSLVFPPDSVSTAQIVGDLVSDLRRDGFRVTVLTTTPHYNPPPESAASSLRPWLGRLLQRSEHDGSTVYHCLMPRKGVSAPARVASWLLFHAASTVLGLFVARPVDVVFAPSPPLTMGVSAWILSLVHRAPYVYNVQEIYPDILVSLGALRPGLMLRVLQALERFVYRKAAVVTVIADRMKARLVEKGVPSAKVRVFPNFVDVGDLKPAPKDNPFSREFGLTNAFSVSYAGNLGPAQGLDVVLDAAALLQDETGIRFVIVGEGIVREALRQRIERERLRNCLLLPYQPYSRMLDLYAASDMSLVPQAAQTGCDAIPSKVYRIMACGRPVVALTDTDSDLARLVRESGGGIVLPPRDPARLAAAIRAAAGEPEGTRAMGVAARQHVLERYERHIVTRQYQDLFVGLCATSP